MNSAKVSCSEKERKIPQVPAVAWAPEEPPRAARAVRLQPITSISWPLFNFEHCPGTAVTGGYWFLPRPRQGNEVRFATYSRKSCLLRRSAGKSKVVGCTMRRIFLIRSLQFFFGLMIEFLVPTFGLTGLLPKLIGPAFNPDLNWSFHFLLSNLKVRPCSEP
jgi:hypothetical protein